MMDIKDVALNAAALLTSYAPESKFANDSPLHYAVTFCYAKTIMEAVGIEPDENIRCWFWQIQAYQSPDKDFDKHFARERSLSTPVLRGALWFSQDGKQLSDDEFRALWPNSR